MSATSLYQQICALRLTASLAYDIHKRAGLSPEQCGEQIRPIAQQLQDMCVKAVVEDLPGCVFAINALESEAKKHEADAAFLQEKATSTRAHAQRLKDLLKEDLKKHGANSRQDQGFMVTLAGEDVTVR